MSRQGAASRARPALHSIATREHRHQPEHPDHHRISAPEEVVANDVLLMAVRRWPSLPLSTPLPPSQQTHQGKDAPGNDCNGPCATDQADPTPPALSSSAVILCVGTDAGAAGNANHTKAGLVASENRSEQINHRREPGTTARCIVIACRPRSVYAVAWAQYHRSASRRIPSSSRTPFSIV